MDRNGRQTLPGQGFDQVTGASYLCGFGKLPKSNDFPLRAPNTLSFFKTYDALPDQAINILFSVFGALSGNDVLLNRPNEVEQAFGAPYFEEAVP